MTPPMHNEVDISAQKPKIRSQTGVKELTLFYRILKDNGMSQQQWGIYYSTFVVENIENNIPFLKIQGSTVSNVSVDTPVANKRRLFEEEEEEVLEDSMETGGKALGKRVLAISRR
jgi:hypothetical protein